MERLLDPAFDIVNTTDLAQVQGKLIKRQYQLPTHPLRRLLRPNQVRREERREKGHRSCMISRQKHDATHSTPTLRGHVSDHESSDDAPSSSQNGWLLGGLLFGRWECKNGTEVAWNPFSVGWE